MRNLFLTASLLFTLIACKPSTGNDSIDTTQVEAPKPKVEAVVKKISISSGKHQIFIVSGKGFEFRTRELTFNVNDTIIIQGDIAYPKSDSTQVSNMW
jgi:hypothetical protein